MQPPRLLVVGGTFMDRVHYVPNLPAHGQATFIQRSEARLGGCAGNVATTAHALGAPVLLISRIGAGERGRFIETALVDLGVPLVGARSRQDNGLCVVLVEPDGERTMLTQPGCDREMDATDVALAAPAAGDLAYISGFEIVLSPGLLDAMCALPQGVDVLFDPGAAVPRPDIAARLLERDVILSLNEDEARAWSGQAQPDQAAVALLAVSSRVVLRLGRDGCLIAQRGRALQRVAATDHVLRDTTGAGDTHAGALASALLRGQDLAGAARFANEAVGRILSARQQQTEAGGTP